MNKETVLLVTAMLAVTCIVCLARDKILESKNQPAASSVSKSAESEDSMTSVSPDIDINFNSENDVESISDEKLRSIANHDFKTADFVHEQRSILHEQSGRNSGSCGNRCKWRTQ